MLDDVLNTPAAEAVGLLVEDGWATMSLADALEILVSRGMSLSPLEDLEAIVAEARDRLAANLKEHCHE